MIVASGSGHEDDPMLHGGKARFMEADVSVEKDVAALVDAALSAFGVSTGPSTTPGPS